MLKVYRAADEKGQLSYVGQSEFKYIPVNEDVELNLGAVADVVVEPKLMDFKTDNYRFDRKRNISGWDEIQHVQNRGQKHPRDSGKGRDSAQFQHAVLDAGKERRIRPVRESRFGHGQVHA